MAHDIIVYLIVGFILILQVKVFLGNYRKIQDYKNTIQYSKNFKMIEVYVDEKEVDKIDIDSLIEFHEQQNNRGGNELKDSEVEIINKAFENISAVKGAPLKTPKDVTQSTQKDLSLKKEKMDAEWDEIVQESTSGKTKENEHL